MASKSFAKNEIIVTASQNNEELYLISEGTVSAQSTGIRLTLKKGDVIGALETAFDDHFINYMALEDTTLIPIPLDGFYSILSKQNDFSAYLYRSSVKQIHEYIDIHKSLRAEADEIYTLIENVYAEYKNICDKCGVSPENFDVFQEKGRFVDDNTINSHLAGYYLEISKLITDGRKVSPEFLDVFTAKLSKDSRLIALGCKKLYMYLVEISSTVLEDASADLYGILSKAFLSSPFAPYSENILALIKRIEEYLNNRSYVDPGTYFDRTSAFGAKVERTKLRQNHSEAEKSIFSELEDSVDKILDYAETDAETRDDFRSLIISYRALQDPRSQDDAARHLRLDITNFFYRFYEIIALKALDDPDIPKVIHMFLEFGYMDEELCTKEDLFYLYEKAGSGYTDPEKGVYTFFEWLKAIYYGKKLPSKDEFDIDYEQFIHDKKVKKQITADEEIKAMDDRTEMVRYELKNMFTSANKVTFGLITIYCPIFNSVNVVRKLPDNLVTSGLVQGVLDNFRSIDFQLFYRDVLYSNEELGIRQEFIHAEVCPDFILMPNVGTRGLMWQEIQGRVRNTPARMLLPVFDNDDLRQHILHMFGEYRWEMCKRIQGARYNDITEPSLTSEYFDYVQFYRKNHDLSAEVKEKIKLSLTRAKNSYKEMFVMDYMTWVLYESEGSPRLNKVARSILSKYCPFDAERRSKLSSNPTYKDNIENYLRKQHARIHRLEMMLQKISNSGCEIPMELSWELVYLNK